MSTVTSADFPSARAPSRSTSVSTEVRQIQRFHARESARYKRSGRDQDVVVRTRDLRPGRRPSTSWQVDTWDDIYFEPQVPITIIPGRDPVPDPVFNHDEL